MLFTWKANVSLVGVTPLLINNGRSASPLDSYAKRMKQLTSKKKKTEEDLRNILQTQWEAGLYWDDEIGLYMPVENMQAALLKACRMHKLGKYVPGFVFDDAIGFPIITENHMNLEALKASEKNKFIKLVTIQRSKTLSCRPIFNKWEIHWDFFVDDMIITIEDVKMILGTMAYRIGLGVWTPSHPKPGNYGKFLIKELKFTNLKTGEVKKHEITNIE